MEVGSSASRYEILAKLAEGGMAEIFLARSTTGAGVERMVVLKRVLRHAAMDEDLVKLFVQEARLAAQLQHPNVVQVYDVGKLGSSYFFSMEYVHGETVRELLLHARHHGLTLPIATVMTIAAGAAAGLSHAHERRGMNGKPLNVVHADISPSNLMITREGVVKIVDFGIAKAEHHTHDPERPVQGKLCYMSPEQVRSQPMDRRSDLFSLGIVLWELLTLRGLFRAESDFNVMDMIITGQTPRPSQLRADVPRDVDEIVLRLLAKNTANRYQSAAELLDAIEVAAMRMGTLLSTASVARQMREWFGVRPEPWVEQTVGGSVKRVVVNSEPVPKDLTTTIAGPIGGVDELLSTMPPANTRPPTTQGSPGWDTPTTEGLEAVRDRLFQAARERKTPPPSELKAFDEAATIAQPMQFDSSGRPLPTLQIESRTEVDAASGNQLRGVSRKEHEERPTPAPQRTTPADATQRTTPADSLPRPTVPGVAPARPSPPAAYSSGPPTHGALDSGAGRPAVARKVGIPGIDYTDPDAPRWRAREPAKTSKIPLILLALLLTGGIGAGGFYLLWRTQLAGHTKAIVQDAAPAPMPDAGAATPDAP